MFSGVMSVLALTTSLYMLEVFDRVLTSRSIETLLMLSVIAVGGLVVLGILDSLRRRLLVRAGLRMVATNAQVGGAAVRSGLRDVDTLRTFLASPACAALFDIPFLLIYLVVLYLLHPLYVVVVVLGGVVLVAVAVIGNMMTSPPLSRSINGSMRAQDFAEDGIRNSDVLEGLGMTPTFVARWRSLWLTAMRSSAEASDRDARVSALSRTLRQGMQIALMATGAMLILDFHASGGVMIGATIIGSRALQPLDLLISSWKTIVSLRMVRDRLNTLLTGAPMREEGMELPAPEGRLQVTGASYVMGPTRRTILNNIRVELEPGEALGVVGPSAAGKSTFARLLVGAWPCSSGAVRLDGANIYSWPRAALGRYIGYLPQDLELFAGTVADNIARMGERDPEAIVRAAKLAHAHEMILSLPQGYDTEIGEAGHWLSGGQRQRVGLARALYGEPRFVVLDEPNSGLDGAGEQALLATLESLKDMKTTVVVIAHRPSILAGMDKMLVLGPGGTVGAYGPAQEVMGRFAAASEAPPASQIAKVDS
jgi:PrtD family type I secretion system ABC transporter